MVKNNTSENKSKKIIGCSFCGKSYKGYLPFTCNYCGKKFCSECRLPENHDCKGLNKHKEKVKRGGSPWFDEKKVDAPLYTNPDYVQKNPFVYYPRRRFNLVKKIKRFFGKINWIKWTVAIIVLLLILSFWKPDMIKDLTPEALSPYTYPIVDFISSIGSGVSESYEKAQAPDLDVFELEKEIHKLVNKERVEQGLKTLEWDDKLSDIARRHSIDMGKNNYFSHEDIEGNNFEYRYRKYGYSCKVSMGSFMYAMGAENIFQNNRYDSITYINGIPIYDWNTQEEIAESTVNGWMDSPGHRENILQPYWGNEGIGVYINHEKDEIFITQNFC